jgi:regulator of RNase E activity RraA
VLVVDTGGDASVAIAGGLLGRLAKLRGLAGLVIDGAIRDLDDLEALGLPIYARAVTPRRAAKAGPADLGGRIRCGGADLTGGDLVLADRDGVVFIPREGLENAITEIEAEVTAEKDLAPDAALISQFEKMLAKAELTRS